MQDSKIFVCKKKLIQQGLIKLFKSDSQDIYKAKANLFCSLGEHKTSFQSYRPHQHNTNPAEPILASPSSQRLVALTDILHTGRSWSGWVNSEIIPQSTKDHEPPHIPSYLWCDINTCALWQRPVALEYSEETPTTLAQILCLTSGWLQADNKITFNSIRP